MIKQTAFVFLSCVAICCLAAPAVQQAYTHPLTNLPAGGSITTTYYFPEHTPKAFPAGDKIKVVVGIHNEGSDAYNITAIMGSLNSPMDFKIYVQNFTQQLYFEVVPPGEELSVEYVFKPDQALTPRDFVVALTLFYEDPKHSFMSTTFFNQTIEIVELPKAFDTDLWMLYVTLCGMCGVACYLISQYLGNLSLFKANKKTRKQTVNKADNQDEWLAGTMYDINKNTKKNKLAKEAKAKEKKQS